MARSVGDELLGSTATNGAGPPVLDLEPEPELDAPPPRQAGAETMSTLRAAPPATPSRFWLAAAVTGVVTLTRKRSAGANAFPADSPLSCPVSRAIRSGRLAAPPAGVFDELNTWG